MLRLTAFDDILLFYFTCNEVNVLVFISASTEYCTSCTADGGQNRPLASRKTSERYRMEDSARQNNCT